MRNRFNLTESEKNRIRGLHKNYSIIKEQVKRGCMDDTAPNYDSTALEDDGSCYEQGGSGYKGQLKYGDEGYISKKSKKRRKKKSTIILKDQVQLSPGSRNYQMSLEKFIEHIKNGGEESLFTYDDNIHIAVLSGHMLNLSDYTWTKGSINDFGDGATQNYKIVGDTIVFEGPKTGQFEGAVISPKAGENTKEVKK